MCFDDECLNAWHVGSVDHFCVGGSIFPGDTHDLAKASKVKLVECFQLLSVELPTLTAIEQGSDDNCLIHCQFSAYRDASLSSYSCPQPAEGTTCLSQSV